jgi:deoxyribodipyrimidine photo-lyase
MPPSVLWFRRDLRFGDHPALLAAAADGPVIALFVLDDALLRPAGTPRLSFLLESLRAMDTELRTLGAHLVIRRGRPEQIVPELVAQTGAAAVHISADFGPYGSLRDTRVGTALGPTPLIATGSPYAVAPGRLRTAVGDSYRVFTPFYRAWLSHGWRPPAPSTASAVTWQAIDGEPIPRTPVLPDGLVLPEAGEAAAHAAWQTFRRQPGEYRTDRDRPDLDRTSRMSPYLKIGSIHPRTLLAALDPADPDDAALRRELAWREFYAAVLHAAPETAREYVKPAMRDLPHATGSVAHQRFQAWADGRTGYPLVDAGMRQLLAEGWMHNRVRMVVASFLVKDLNLEWPAGARHFMRHLVDGDLASNQHGWQWTAGTGTDAAPYFRIYNPTTQAERYDPDGVYVRRFVRELAGLSAPAIHRPWRCPGGPPNGYPLPIVDHEQQRVATLAAYQALRRGTP